MIRFYYTTGVIYSQRYSGQPSDSIGGLVTNVPIGNGLNNLFGIVSKHSLTNGVEDYRCIFMQNLTGSDLTDLSFHMDVAILASDPDPAVAAPAPSPGDKFIVPENGVGAWKDKDGQEANWDGAKWIFDIADFEKFEFAFLVPQDFELNDTLLTKAFVTQNLTPFIPPAVTFASANGSANATTIGTGDFSENDWLAVWIKRTIKKEEIPKDFLTKDAGPYKREKPIDLVFTYDP